MFSQSIHNLRKVLNGAGLMGGRDARTRLTALDREPQPLSACFAPFLHALPFDAS
jgi:hypothetical protein